MANETPFVPPDLAAVLATLSQFAPCTPPPGAQPQSAAQEQLCIAEDDVYDPADIPVARPQTRTSQPPPLRKAQPQQQVIDPSSITQWSEGLRCVSKVSSLNPQFAESIKRVGITDLRVDAPSS